MSTVTAPHPRISQQGGRDADTRRVGSCLLGRYTDDRTNTPREIVCVPGADGSRLVIDRDALTLGDKRLVAHLAADEAPENAQIVCEIYLADESKGACRRVSTNDLKLTPFARSPAGTEGEASPDTRLIGPHGVVYQIHEVSTDGSSPMLRWTCSRHPGQEEPFDVVTLRDVVAGMEDYEPARSITSAALAVQDHERRVSTHQLRGELKRLNMSEIVLNRGLREAVKRKVALGDMTMSQIAVRCGRIKQDKRGNRSGETSWLARRIGQLPDSGMNAPTPWVHSDILALIVRDGLGCSPHEVEL